MDIVASLGSQFPTVVTCSLVAISLIGAGIYIGPPLWHNYQMSKQDDREE